MIKFYVDFNHSHLHNSMSTTGKQQTPSNEYIHH